MKLVIVHVAGYEGGDALAIRHADGTFLCYRQRRPWRLVISFKFTSLFWSDQSNRQPADCRLRDEMSGRKQWQSRRVNTESQLNIPNRPATIGANSGGVNRERVPFSLLSPPIAPVSPYRTGSVLYSRWLFSTWTTSITDSSDGSLRRAVAASAKRKDL